MDKEDSKSVVRTLILGKNWPEPHSSAAGIRMMQLIEALQTLGPVSFASAANRNVHSEDLAKLRIQEFDIQINDSKFDEFIVQRQPDIVVFDRFMTEEQFGWRVAKHAPNALRVLDTEDLHGLREARFRAGKENRGMTNLDLQNDTMLRELAAIYRCDLSLIISEAEMKLLVQNIGVHNELLHYVPFMFTKVKKPFKKSLPGFEQRSGFVTIGNLLHPPNRDAVQVLCREVWPEIRKRLPSVEIHVYGAYTDASIQQLNSPKNGFHVHGRAEDVNDVMSRARVCVAPLRFGAGLKGKFFDAMQNGTPSVTTSLGSEGIAGELSWCGFIADNWSEFAQRAVELYNNSALWEHSQTNGFRILDERFVKRRIQKGLIDRLQHSLVCKEDARRNNFIGAMLQHHTLKSTEYMSRWIEEKNSRTQKIH